MTHNRPQYFYKYFSKERFDFLRLLMLRYAPHDSFNDPFENCPSEPEKIDQLSKEEVSAMSASIRDEFTYSNELVSKVLAQRAQSDSAVLDHGDYKERLGTVCLSETHDNLLMWAHYASEHRGFVVEFDSSYFFEFADSSEEKAWLFGVDRVKYREMRVRDQPMDAWDFFYGTYHEIGTTKSTHWSHEQEWRMTRPLREAELVVKEENGQLRRDESSHLIHLFTVPKKYISCVILGARASNKHMSFVRRMLEEDAELSHVKLKLAVPDPVDFRLRFVNTKVGDLPPADERPI